MKQQKYVFWDKYESSAYLYNKINTNFLSIVIGEFIAKSFFVEKAYRYVKDGIIVR